LHRNNKCAKICKYNDLQGDFMKKMIVILVCVLSVSFLFVGCGTLKPMTKNVVGDVGGITEINKFQYYTSSGISLTATEIVKEPNFNKQGSANVKEIAYRNILTISKFTMGALMDSHIDDDGKMILEICFEEKAEDSDKRLLFKQDGLGLESKFYLVYTEPRKGIVRYGSSDYNVETKSGERIYLIIKFDKTKIEKERIRKVKGRKVQY
jgi:hypothetical protein